MRLLSILSSLVLGIQTVAAASAATEAMPAPPTLAFLFSANITAGLSVDVGGIPSGNVSVIPVIGGSLIGPDVSGMVSAALAIERGDEAAILTFSQERSSPLERSGRWLRRAVSGTAICERRFGRRRTSTSTCRWQG